MWGMQPLLIALHTGVHDEEALRPKLRARCGRSCDLSLERPASVAVKETGRSVFECESSKTENVWARDVTQQRSISRRRGNMEPRRYNEASETVTRRGL